MGDEFIPDSDFEPDQELDRGPAAQPAQQPSPASSPEFVPDNQFKADESDAQASPDFVPENQFVPDEEKFGSTGQQVAAGLEGIAQGVAGPLATGAERLAGVPAQDIAGRAAANPWTHGIGEGAGFIGGMFTGSSEAALLGKAGEAALAASKIGEATTASAKIGAMALKGAVEGGLFQTGEELNKYILGQSDPETPWANAASNIGYGAVLGGGLSAGIGSAAQGLRALGETELGGKASQLIKDMGSKLSFYKDTPDVASAMTTELRDHYATTNEALDGVYGFGGAKSRAISKLTEDVTPDQVQKHIDQIEGVIRNAPKSLQESPDFQEAVNDWRSSATKQQPGMYGSSTVPASPEDAFKATDSFKKLLGEWSKFNPAADIPPSRQAFINAARTTGFGLKSSLEDSSVWNKAGDFQKNLNAAVSGLIGKQGPLQDFESVFNDRYADRTVSAQKMNTFVNNYGKPSAEIKDTVLNNYLDAAQKAREQINGLYASIGEASPITQNPLGVTKTFLGTPTPGSKLADTIHNLGISKAASMISNYGHVSVLSSMGGATGGIPGAIAGAGLGLIMPHIEAALGRSIKTSAIPMVIKVLSGGNPEAIATALEHSGNVQQGQSAIQSVINSLFSGSKATAQQISAYRGREHDKEKIKKFVAGGGTNTQIQNQAQSDARQKTNVAGAQNFAEGGEVHPNPQPDVSGYPDHFANAFPAENILKNAAKGRIYSYLNSIRPQENQPKLPFDQETPNDQQEKEYDRAVGLAASPLSIFKSIKDGSLTSNDLGHFTKMWPDIHNHLNKEMTKRVIEAQTNKEPPPPYKSRQAMSLFMGSPLDSTMTPQSIQAAQAVYMKPQAPPTQGGGKSKKGTSKLGEASKQYQTSTQAAEARQKNG